MTELKAVSILDARSYVLERFGPEGQQKLMALLSVADREVLYAESLLPVSWVEVAAVVRHVDAYDRAFGIGDGKAASAMLKAVAHKQFYGIYRSSYEKIPSPRELIEVSTRLWKRFYNRGSAIIEARAATEFIGKIVDCPDLPVNHEVLFIPYWEEVLKLSGAKRVTIVHTQCVARGAACCVSEYRWS